MYGNETRENAMRICLYCKILFTFLARYRSSRRVVKWACARTHLLTCTWHMASAHEPLPLSLYYAVKTKYNGNG